MINSNSKISMTDAEYYDRKNRVTGHITKFHCNINANNKNSLDVTTESESSQLLIYNLDICKRCLFTVKIQSRNANEITWLSVSHKTEETIDLKDEKLKQNIIYLHYSLHKKGDKNWALTNKKQFEIVRQNLIELYYK